MSKAYTASGPNASGTALKTLLTVIGAATVRPRLYDLTLGSSQTPADQAGQFRVGRFTAVGTSAGSAPTPEPLDPSDVAALATVGWTHSAEPTYTAGKNLLTIPKNQRATYRWVASPGCELVGPATANNGLGLYLVSATAAMIEDGCLCWLE